MIITLIVAAGKGLRMGENEPPKQYQKLLGKSIVVRSFEAFANLSVIDKVVVVINPHHEAMFRDAFRGYEVEFCYGGQERSDSVFNGLEFIKKYHPSKVLIHDAARPLVSAEIINGVIAKLNDYKAVDVGLRAVDTIKMMQGDKPTVLDRDRVYMTQTPQGFDYEFLYGLLKDQRGRTDEITLALECNEAVAVVPGEQMNFKITTAPDMLLAEYYLKVGNV